MSFLDELTVIKGIGPESIADIKRAGISSLDELKARLERDSVPLRNDVVEKLKKILEVE